ncbi:hypothetical protein F4703DRAFT_1856179 [Phycomyces blakesleeanus]
MLIGKKEKKQSKVMNKPSPPPPPLSLSLYFFYLFIYFPSFLPYLLPYLSSLSFLHSFIFSFIPPLLPFSLFLLHSNQRLYCIFIKIYVGLSKLLCYIFYISASHNG